MKMKGFIVLILTLSLLIPETSQIVFADNDLLNSKAVYYTEESDYISGDCVLTATRLMIRRSAIMHNKQGWEDITNASLRPEATVDDLLLYSFSYDAEGVTYNIKCGSFSGESNAARLEEFENILKAHPEGIVVHGENAASTGTHGVLLVRVENGVAYAADSSCNMGQTSEGIQKWEDTTMLDPLLVTDYWYISSVEIEGISPNMVPVEEHFIIRKLSLESV